MRTPDRGSTTGAASRTDCEPASRLPRRGERSESIPPHRHILRRARTQVRAFFSHVAPTGGDGNPRPGFDNWQRQLDRPRACERAAPTKTPGAFLNNACVGPAGARPRDGPSNGERSESIPPHRHILRRARTHVRAFFSHVAPAGGMRTPDRGSTTGAASWTDCQPASGLPRQKRRERF
ncbi:Uncharacterised protein [Klebsiella pneumoniae]|nr:hypothetical protein AI2667V1_3025 [Klebsiella pneumoniae]CAH3846769.1 hypothetical protein AI2667V1_3025 [Klebsiella pneumoniae]SWP13438.1 Uncharacterised protein [Klebsiella pneumoniae]